MANGLYRVKDGWRDGEDSAVLGAESSIYIEIAEHSYREFGYAPPFDELPWRPEAASGKHPVRPQGYA